MELRGYGGAETVVGKPGDTPLGADFRYAVRGYRIDGAGLIQHVVARGTVVAAGRREDEPGNARRLGAFGEPYRSQMVDLEGQLRVEIAERIIGQPGEMQDRIEAGQIGGNGAPADAFLIEGRRMMSPVYVQSTNRPLSRPTTS